MGVVSLIHRFPLSLALNFARMNIRREKLMERESLVQSGRCARNLVEKGHVWAWFRIKLFLSFNFFVPNIHMGEF